MKKVLVVDDDPVTRKLICKSLNAAGLVCFESSSGRRAMEVLADNTDVVLLITDMAMPDLGGKELIEHVRSHEATVELPIIIVSGVVGPKQIGDLLEQGASRFLPKPIDTTLLKEYALHLTRDH